MSVTPKTDIEVVKRTMRYFAGHGNLGEVRILSSEGVPSGFFYRYDEVDQAAELVASRDLDSKGIYLVMNEIDPAVLDGRETLYFQYHSLTKDVSIVRRRKLLVDCDPTSTDRGADDSATDHEKANSFSVREEIYEYLSALGFPEPAFGDSGNGTHLLWSIDLPNDAEAKQLIATFLSELAKRFSTDNVSIDTSVHNASRITKLYGTVARKGEDLPNRPHRLSSIELGSADHTSIVTRAMLLAAIGDLSVDRCSSLILPNELPLLTGSQWKLHTNDVATKKPKLIVPERFRNGERHCSLVAVAGGVRSFGASECEILEILRIFNRTRCASAKPDDELQKIARDYSVKDFNLPMKAMMEGEAADKIDLAERQQKLKLSLSYATDRIASGDDSDEVALELQAKILQLFRDSNRVPDIISLEKLIEEHPTLSPAVIDGLARRGEVVNVIAKSKVGKSWFTYGLALCVASGWEWLGRFNTTRGRVMIIDNELPKPVLANRIPQVQKALLIPDEFIRGQVDLLSLRGNLRGIMELDQLFENMKEGQYSLIIIDAMYRMLPNGMSENDNAAMAAVYNQVDRYAAKSGAAIVLVHHAAKGSQDGKDVTDVGSGAGSQSRAADSHLVLRSHEQQDAAVLEAAVRSWAPVKPLALRWTFPVWSPDEALNPEDLRGRKPASEQRQAAKDAEGEEVIYTKLVENGPATIKKLVSYTGIGKDRVRRLLGHLQLAERITSRPTNVRGNETDEYLVA